MDRRAAPEPAWAAVGAALVALVAGVAVVPAAAAQAARAVTGYALARSDSSPLAGVRVSVVGATARTATDGDGRFRLTGLAAGSWRIAFDRIGLVPDTVTLGSGRDSITAYLRSSPVLLAPIVAEAQPIARERFELLAQTSTMSLDAAEIEHVPGLAEPDVARAVQLLPGTVAKNDYSTGFNVRGGESDQNLVRLDGTVIFNPSHLGGLFSTFDPTAVTRVDFLTGAFPASYGGRLSSVLDVELRDGDAEHTGLHGSVSALASKLLLDGPLGGTGMTYLVGGRRTYADAFADSFSDDVFSYYFGDAVGKVALPLGAGGSVSVTGYWGRDRLRLPWVDPEPGRPGVDLEFWWGNRVLGGTWRQPLGRAVLEQHVGVSAFSAQFALTPDVLTIDNSARLITADATVAMPWVLGQARLGGAYERYLMRYSARDEVLGQQQANLEYSPAVWSAFFDDQWKPFRWLLLRPGVRVDRVLRGAQFTGVSPRGSMKLFLTDDLALTGSAGRYHQAIHSIQDQELPLTIFDVWIGADTVTPVSRADHVVGGVEKWFGESTSLTVEAYRKTFANLLVPNPADDPRVNGDEFTPADGDARGFDILLRQHWGSIRGWVAYSYTKTERRTASDTFPPAHDRRHTLNVTLEAPGPLGSELGVRWGYGSPLPYTGIVGEWLHREYNPERNAFDRFDEEVVSTTINGERYPPYSRLDISFRWAFDWLGGTWRPYLQIVNAYNRRNVFVYSFDYATVPATRSGISQLPLLPTVGVAFEF